MGSENNKGKPAATVKRVTPYPIETKVFKVEGQAPIKGQIWKLTDVGFLMKVESMYYFKVTEELIADFILPASNHEIKAACKVVKTYDIMEHLSRDQKVKLLTVEMHFLHLTDDNKKWIVAYLEGSGQAKK